MDILNWQAALEAANTAFIAEVEAPEGVDAPTVDLLAMEVDATGASAIEVGYVEDNAEIRRVIANVPQPRDGARAYAATYPVLTWSITDQLPRRQVKGDRSGRVAKMLAALARRSVVARKLWDYILANDVNGPDGVPLLSATHPHAPGGATQSNAVATALTDASYNAGRAAMRGWRRENGESLDKVATHLVVGPGLERTALEVTGSSRPLAVSNAGVFDATANVVGATTRDNGLAGSATVVVEPKITGTEWYLIDASGSARPMAFGRDGGRETVVPEIGDDSVKDLDMMVWQIKEDLAIGPANWQNIYGGGLTL